MLWTEIKTKYPNQWLVVEASDAHTNPEGKRVLQDLALLELCRDGTDAFRIYRKYHMLNPNREYFYLHTSREEIEIVEERWLGIRIPCAPSA